MVSTPIAQVQLVEAVEPLARQASWVVAVGISDANLLESACACNGPVLAVLPDQACITQLEEQCLELMPSRLQFQVHLLGAEGMERPWFHYNDPRLNGTTSIEQLQPIHPNLRLERVELREQITFADLLDGWQPTHEDGGMLLITGPVRELLETGGAHLRKVASFVWIPQAISNISPGAELEKECADLAQVDACCQANWLRRDCAHTGPSAWLVWQRDETLRFQATVLEERDRLLARCELLQATLAARDEQLTQINQELDSIIDMIE